MNRLGILTLATLALTAVPGTQGDSARITNPSLTITHDVNIRLVETVGGVPREIGSMTLPVAGLDEPSTMGLAFGDLEVAGTATVSEDEGIAATTARLAIRRGGSLLTEPVVRVAVGETAEIRIGSPRDGIGIRVVATRR